MADLVKDIKRPVFSPQLDIIDTGEAFVVFADVPGATREGVEINLEDDLLTIRASVTPPEVGGLPLVYSEYRIGDYETVLRVSNAVDREKITAEIKNGVLAVTLPKVEAVKPRKIEVKAA